MSRSAGGRSSTRRSPTSMWPLGLALEPGDGPQRRRLAAPRRPEHHEQLAVGDRQVQALDRDGAVGEALVQPCDLDARHQRRTAPRVTPATRCLRTRNAKSRTGAREDHRRRGHEAPVDRRAADQPGDGRRRRPRRFARRQEDREDELVPGEDQREHGGRGDARDQQRQRHPEEGLEPRVAVEHRRVLVLRRDLVDEALHHPDREREVERRVDQDQPELRVDQVEVPVHEEDRDHDHHRRHEAGGEDEEELVLLQLDRNRE